MRVFSKILVILVIIALAFTGVYFYKTYYKNEKIDEEEKSVDWKNVYSEIIADESNFNDLDEIKLELCDLDKNNVPELIVIGEKDKETYGAKIYRINKENKVDTVKFELEEEFSLKFLQNVDKDTYNWYVVTDDDKVVYELEAKDKDYNIKKSEYLYSEDFEVIDKGKEISFDVKDDEAKEVIKKLEESYKPINELVPEKSKDKNNSLDKENQNAVNNSSNTTNTTNSKNNTNTKNTNKNSSKDNKKNNSNSSKNQSSNNNTNTLKNNTSNNVKDNTSNNKKDRNKTSKNETNSNTSKKLDEIFDFLK